MNAISDFLKQNTSLKILNLANCNLGSEGVTILAESLCTIQDQQAYNIQLWELILCNNSMDDKAAEELAKYLRYVPTIERLDISSNNCKRGLKSVLVALSSSSQSLKELNLSDNVSINKAIVQFDTLLERATNLEVLKFSNLNMKKEYCRLISNTLIKEAKKPQQPGRSQLQHIEWNKDMRKCCSTAIKFIQ